ncbi:MAG: WG repeat-containing protein [Flavobacteriia bacterium]|nr:WG repeat-containing protein [Flavobacteriia bacterium]
MISRVLLLLFSIALLPTIAVHALDPIQKGFEQLKLKNYHTASVSFSQGMKICPSVAAYGKAMLYFNSKDMENVDSALLYIGISRQSLSQVNDLKQKKKRSYESFGWSVDNVLALEQKILGNYLFLLQLKSNSPQPYSRFIENHSQFKEIQKVVDLRDSLWLDSCKNEGSLCYQKLLKTSPQSTYKDQIQQSMHIQTYKEWVKSGEEKELQGFLIYHPGHALAASAEDEIYRLVSTTSDTNEFKRFIKTYPENKNVNRIWKEFFLQSAGNYIPEKMSAFIKNNPAYPFKDAVISELEMFDKTLYPCVKEELYGFMDESGMVRISPKYDWVGEFKEGLAVALLCDAYGVVDKKGQLHIPFNFQFISDFQEGVAIFQNENNYGLINRAGKVVIKNQYEDMGWLTSEYLFFKEDSLFGVLDIAGKVVVQPEFQEIQFLSKAFIRVQKRGWSGVWNTKLNPVLQTEFDEIVLKENGFLVTKQGKQGLIDFIGNPLIPVVYDAIGEVSEGFVLVQKNQKFTHVNTRSWKLNPIWNDVFPNFIKLSMMVNGTFLIQKKSKFYGLDTLGKLSKPLAYFELGDPGKWVPVLKQKGGKWGFVDRKGMEMTLFEFDYVEKLNDVLFAVSSDGKTGVLSCEEGFVLPMEFDDVVLWNGDRLLAFKDEKRGIFTTMGMKVVECEFDMIQQFNPFTWVLKKGNEILYFFPETKEFLKRKM